MVEDNPFNFPPVPESEDRLVSYLDYLIKDRLLPGVDMLLLARIKTCQDRIQLLPELIHRLISAKSEE